jgi:hypothetical protein
MQNNRAVFAELNLHELGLVIKHDFLRITATFTNRFNLLNAKLTFLYLKSIEVSFLYQIRFP